MIDGRQIVIREARTAAGREQALAIRCTVFVAEQGVARTAEIDGQDDAARHLLALLDGRPVGTLRVRFLDAGRVAKIERVAVLAAARGRRVGAALIRAALELARAEGAAQARLHAQTVVQDFYARLGFVALGPEFEEDGIMHIAMRLALTAERAQQPALTAERRRS
jgi:predicted GNAT family N-acyltransferase